MTMTGASQSISFQLRLGGLSSPGVGSGYFLCVMTLKNGLLIPLGSIEPSPTILRRVSGRKRNSTSQSTLAEIVKNQKIECQPRYCPCVRKFTQAFHTITAYRDQLTSNEPITGPIAGASMAPELAMATIPPLSLGLAMSATVPCERAIILAEPVACTHRSTKSSQYTCVRANPMFAHM